MPGLALTVGFFTLCMMCVFLLFNFAQAQTKMTELNVSTAIIADENSSLPLNNTILRIAPFPLNIKVPAHTVIPPYGLHVTAEKNITNIKAQFSDLIPEGANNLWIPRDKITTNPETFNVTAGHLTDVDLLINASNATGSYHGTMTLSYPGGISQFQISLNIFEDLSLYVYTIIVLGLGVFTSFFVKLIRIQNDARQDALDTFNESRNEMVKANEEKRLSTEFDSGARKFFDGLEMLEQGFFVDSKKMFEVAAQLFRSAKKDEKSVEGEIQKPNTEIPSESVILEVARKISGKGLTRSLRQDSVILYIITSILLFVAVIQVWFTALPQILPLVNSYFLYLSTFLIGYGSQSILGEIVEFARRR